MIGNTIRQLRIKEKKETNDIAKALDMNLKTYTDLEEGVVAPDCVVLNRIADFYHEDIHVFFKQDCTVSLHDQRCSRIEADEDGIRFFFPEGFNLCAEFQDKTRSRSYRTSKASMMMHYNTRSFEPVQIRYFESDHQGEKVVHEAELGFLEKEINEKGKQLEFITEYKSYWTTLLECCLWQNTEPYCTDYQIYVDAERIEYQWDTLSEE